MIPNKAFQALACGDAARHRRHAGGARAPARRRERAARPARRRRGARGRGPTARRRRPDLAERLGAGGLAAYREHASEAGARRALARPPRAARRAMTPRAAVVRVGVAAFAAGFGVAAVLRHLAFDTGRFDLGNMVQAVWSTAHGDLLAVTDLHGEQISRLGAHFDPILAALRAALVALARPELLLVVQAIAVALGALPVFLLARKHLGSERPAAALRARLPALPADAVAGAERVPPGRPRDPAPARRLLVPRRGPALGRSRSSPPRRSLTKEHVGLVVAAMGVWYAVAPRRAPDRRSRSRVAGRLGRARRGARRRAALRAGGRRRRSRAATTSPSLDRRDLALPRPTLAASRSLFLPLAAPLRRARARCRSSGSTCSRRPHADVDPLPLRRRSRSRRSSRRPSSARPARPAARLRSPLAAAARPGCSCSARSAGSISGADAHDAAAQRRALALVPDGRAGQRHELARRPPVGRRRILSFPVLSRRDWIAVDERRLTYCDRLAPQRRDPRSAALRLDRGGASSSTRTASSSSGAR